MSILARLKDKMTGRMSPEEEEIKRRADARAAEYEVATGEAAPEEEGIQEDYTLEETASLVNPVGLVKSGAKAAAKGAAKSGILSRLKDMLPGQDKRSQSPLSTKDAELRQAALRDAETLQEIKRVGPEAAEQAMAAERKQRLLDLEKLQAARDRTGPAGSLTSKDVNPTQDYSKYKIQQQPEGPTLSADLFSKSPKRKAPSDTVIQYKDGKAVGSRKRRAGEE